MINCNRTASAFEKVLTTSGNTFCCNVFGKNVQSKLLMKLALKDTRSNDIMSGPIVCPLTQTMDLRQFIFIEGETLKSLNLRG